MTVLDRNPDTQLCAGMKTSLFSHGRGTSTSVPSSGQRSQHGPDTISTLSFNNHSLPDDQLGGESPDDQESPRT